MPKENGLPGKKHCPEAIIGNLHEAEVVLAQGATTAAACHRIAASEQTYYQCARNMAAWRPIRRAG